MTCRPLRRAEAPHDVECGFAMNQGMSVAIEYRLFCTFGADGEIHFLAGKLVRAIAT